jgi:POT family proton-dependent oligopeptide transporter
MAVPSLLHVALGLLIIGNGFFKPNTSSMVGELYDDVHDPRRDGGYTIFYMGINLGATFSPLVCGTLGEKVGWHYGFAAAGVGMAFGLFTLLSFQRLIGRAGLRDDQHAVTWKDLPVIAIWTIASIGVIYASLAVWPMISGIPTLGKILGGIAMIALAVWLPGLLGDKSRKEASQSLTGAEWSRVIAVCIVVFFSIFFWMGFEQAGGSMNLFADKQTERTLAGFEVPASWFQTINPALILLLAPFFSMMWTAINRSRFSLPDTAKQGLGIVVLGLGFVVMYLAQTRADSLGPVSPLWLASAYTLHTLGELMLSPVGLALTSRAAPARIAALLMGVWMFSSAAGNYLAGSLESLMNGTGIQPYLFLTISSIGMGVLLLLLTPILHKMLEKRDISTTA